MKNIRYLSCIGILLALTILIVGCVGSPEEQKLAELTKKAQEGDAEAQLSLAAIYYSGEGVPKDLPKAFELYQKAAVQGNAEAQIKLARMYYLGESVPKDMAKVFE